MKGSVFYGAARPLKHLWRDNGFYMRHQV